jgi:formamidopyrimidine-DNA glycosylase
MPELPDLSIYLTALKDRIEGETLTSVRLASPFVLRTVEPLVKTLVGQRVIGLRRIGKQIVIELEDDLFIVVHLMIAGRLRWYKKGAKIPGKLGLLAFDFSPGSLILTEAGHKHRASVHFVAGRKNLEEFNRGGLEIFDISLEKFVTALSIENHTLKRSLTDQRFIAGIGNAYSDEILHHARLSPMKQTRFLKDDEWLTLYNSCQFVLSKWIDILAEKSSGSFPVKVTAFHEEMAVHGKYKQPCPDCGKPVQRIRYASNECNYCAQCQNQGNLLADRALSRLLKKDWPKKLEDLD